MKCERGQASVEWVGLVLVSAIVLGGVASAAPSVDGRSLGAAIAHRLTCAARGGCDDGDAALAAAYGGPAAARVRRFAPGLVYEPGERQLPVDFRRCRRPACALAPDDRDLDAGRTDAGHRVTAFTSVRRAGGRTYLQYWFYYPDSDTKLGPSDRITKQRYVAAALDLIGRNPYHRDDWEGFTVRIGRDGSASGRTSSHGHWQSCKWRDCRDRWGPLTGWTRVSRGSHAGHVPYARVLGRTRIPVIPGRGLRERTSTAPGMRLIPLETLGRARRRYRRIDPDIAPPWEKEAWEDPESPRS